jgi:hypothetical protein
MALWTPANLAIAPLVWFDAQDATTITHASGDVSAWASKTNGVGLALDGGSGDPSYGALNFMGALPGVRFFGDERMLAALASTHTGPDFTGFVCAQADNVAHGFGQVTSLSALAEAPPYDSEHGMILMAYSGTPGDAVAFTQGIPHNTTYNWSTTGDILMGISRGTADEVGVRLNGAAELTSSIARNAGATHVMVGGDCHDDNYHFEGVVSEVIWLGYEPTSGERQRIEGYLAWRWGLEAKLPSGHPYESVAPTIGGGWSPANLAVPPRLWVSASNATWSGSNLVSVPNNGSDGGTSGTLGGTPDKGSTLSGVDGIRIDADGEYVPFGLGSFAGGSLFCFILLQNITGTPGIDRFDLCRSYPGAGGTAFSHEIISAVPGYAYAAGNGNGTAPIFANENSQTESVNTATPYLVSYQLGGVNELYVNAILSTTSVGALTGAIPSYAAAAWHLGNDTTTITHPGSASYWEVVLLDYAPTTAERQLLEGWASWSYYGDGTLLPIGHPYKSAAPQASSLTAAAGALTVGGQVAGTLFARKVAGGSGALNVSAQPASLLYGRKVASGLGAFTVGGQAATLTKSNVAANTLAADVGAYGLSGASSGLLVGRLVTAGAWALNLAGQEGALRAAKRVQGGGGSLLLDGQAATLTFAFPAAHSLSVEAGGFVLAMQPARLDYSGLEFWTPIPPNAAAWSAVDPLAGAWMPIPRASGGWS